MSWMQPSTALTTADAETLRRITQGERYFPPPVRAEPGRPKLGSELALYVHAKRQFVASGHGHYAGLRPRLDHHADNLARRIDRAARNALTAPCSISLSSV
ncbi:hypothetical protein U2F26_31970 [Micromonospora sp. 4G57]|uniref:Uncharacterized protein n=1 Tax=Micromonospora sicca TaxID=2202420 RepID=A0ABU5JMW8_9ACTN|nr:MULTISPECIES: hypothetical protein [unclassified Micromonospora]MDZ5447274.1 hypothetical protein [Micromonospora sp. 4G57]MDZ5493970.1 hypothetical protein [Micromonospora sp. 4G53]